MDKRSNLDKDCSSMVIVGDVAQPSYDYDLGDTYVVGVLGTPASPPYDPIHLQTALPYRERLQPHGQPAILSAKANGIKHLVAHHHQIKETKEPHLS